jgi:hypothetical protein
MTARQTRPVREHILAWPREIRITPKIVGAAVEPESDVMKCNDTYSAGEDDFQICNLRDGHYDKASSLHATWSRVEDGKWRLEKCEPTPWNPSPQVRDNPPWIDPLPDPIKGPRHE